MFSFFNQIGNIFVIILPATSGLFFLGQNYLISAQQLGGEVVPRQASVIGIILCFISCLWKHILLDNL